MAYFDELMQRAITVRNNVAPSSNTALLVGGVLVSIVSALQLLLDTKQGTLTFDDEPTDGSTNPVTSDGIYEAIADAIASIDLSACEKIVNKVTALSAQSTDVQYPSAKCVYDALQAIDLSACEKIVNKVTSLSAQSTDTQYPSAKLLYDSLQALANEYAAINHTHHYTDIEQPAIVATAGAQGYTITTADYSHIITLTADTTLHLPTITAGTARIMRLTLIQDLTGGHGVTFDGGNAMVYNPYQVDLSQGLGGYRCWVTLWFDGAQWCYIATPYVLRSESQFDYTISGTSTGASVTITINGSTMNIPVNAGVWEYGYNGAVTSLSLAGDTGVTTIDFSLSDGLAGVTSLAGAFSGCSALQSIDFTDCDLSAIVDATNAFSGCSALTALTIPSGEWLPDLDLSATAIGYSAMADVIIGLHTYASGTHTVTFNATIWDALTPAQQQTISDAASAKGWTTNAVAVVYAIKGKSTAASETFTLQFIDDNTQAITTETITCAVEGSGNWEYEYSRKKIYSLANAWRNNTTITSLDFSATDGLTELASMENMCSQTGANISNITNIDFSNCTLEKCTNIKLAFNYCGKSTLSLSFVDATFAALNNINGAFAGFGGNSLTINATLSNVTDCGSAFYLCKAIISLPNATFASASNANLTFSQITQTTLSLPNATFANVLNASYMFANNANLTALSLPNATFASATTTANMFYLSNKLQTISLPLATFENVTIASAMFNNNFSSLTETISLPLATFDKVTNATAMFVSPKINTLNIPNATFARVTNTTNMFAYATLLTSFDCYTDTFNVTFSLAPCPLTYQSMVNVANWCKDLTGGTAQTLTLNTTAWNALTAAEQANIDTILSAKNWTRAIA